MTLPSMANKTCVVTGANSGIGLVTARVLVAQGARVLMVCRNESRGTQAAQHIEEATGSRPELVLCDLSDPQQIEQAAAQIPKKTMPGGT